MISFDKKAKLLLGLSLGYAILSVIVFTITNNIVHTALIWNLFLAILPLIFSLYLKIAIEKKQKVLIILFSLLWLFFFPNAHYIATDLVHLSTIKVYTMNTLEIIYWLRLVHIEIGVLLGLIFGLLSLYNVHLILLKYRSKVIANTMIIIISLLSGYAIYIGRFLRFNSWDIFNLNLFKELLLNLDLFAVTFSCLFAFYILFTYLIFYCLIKK